MTYQSLYRRFRPRRFGEVRGQDHLVGALRNAVRDDRVGHAYLFSGPRGTGKTTTARILAKALNCESLDDGEPCGECDSCRSISDGSSFDVFELDAASNNGVDAIRDLIDRAAQSTPGRTRVYILDEVHMLSTAAANALLKTLEEPPEHVVFVLATTDPQKVPPTVRSRTQHYEVHLLDADTLEGLLTDVVDAAELDVDPAGIQYALRAGGGSARDTLSALEQVVAFGGVPEDTSAIHEVVEALCDHDTGDALVAVERALAGGRAPRTLGEDLIDRLRDIFLTAVGSPPERLPEADRASVADQAERLGPRGATHALEVLGDAFVSIADAPDPRIPLELALVRLTSPSLDRSLDALAARVDHLERALATGATAVASAQPAPVAATAPSAPPAEPTAASTSTGTAPAGGGMAAAARDALAAKRGRGGPSTPRTAPSGSDGASTGGTGGTPAPAEPQINGGDTAAASSPPTPTAAQPGGAPGAEAPGAAAGAEPPAATQHSSGGAQPAVATPPGDASGQDGLPDRAELTVAWGDTILGSLPQKAKARFGAGRFVDVVDGRAVYGLPNDVHRKRCEELRGEVEAALAAHFGRPVPLRLVVDGDPEQTNGGAAASAGARPSPGAGPASGSDPAPGRATTGADPANDADEDLSALDIAELEDAEDVATDEVTRIAEVFPGVEVVEEQELGP
ncbi:MAG: DNA polymerase III subunit gamma/tau [Acidimicrobiia bacterium]|nr:DNA polymerase III subunit gamma/tau [Acidimicrobiia bacterium]